MLVLNIKNSDVDIIKEALEGLEECSRNQLDEELDPEVEIATENTIQRCEFLRRYYIGDNWIQRGELVEKCLGYFWDRFKEEGIESPEIEYLMDDMGLEEWEFRDLFMALGYEED